MGIAASPTRRHGPTTNTRHSARHLGRAAAARPLRDRHSSVGRCTYLFTYIDDLGPMCAHLNNLLPDARHGLRHATAPLAHCRREIIGNWYWSVLYGGGRRGRKALPTPFSAAARLLH